MSLLSSADLDAMRGVLNESLPDTAVIYSASYVSDGGGGDTTSWTAVGTVACRVQPYPSSGEDEDQLGGRITADVDRIITVPATTSVNTNQELGVGSQRFRIEAVRAPRSYAVSRRIEASEVVN